MNFVNKCYIAVRFALSDNDSLPWRAPRKDNEMDIGYIRPDAKNWDDSPGGITYIGEPANDDHDDGLAVYWIAHVAGSLTFFGAGVIVGMIFS